MHPPKYLFSFITILLLSLYRPCNSQTLSSEDTLTKIRKLYYAAIESEEPVEQGLRLAQNASNLDPNLRSAYQGSFLCFVARDSTWPLRKWNKAQEGLDLLDKAVSEAPRSLEIRVLRAAITSHLPSFFNRQDQAKTDIAWIRATLNSAEFASLPIHMHDFIKNFLNTVANF